MKKILLIALLLPATSFAHNIVITAAVPFPASVTASSTNVAVFNVKNITARTPLTVIDQSKLPSGLSIIGNTCGGLLNPGQSCAISVQLVAPANPQTVYGELREWAKPSADGVRFPFTVNVTTIPALVAVGQNQSDFTLLLAANIGSVTTWGLPTIPGLPSAGSFDSASCSGNNCIAVGINSDSGNGLIVMGANANWNVVSVPSAPSSYSLSGSGCTGTGASQICIAAGVDGTGDNPGLILQTTNGGATWSVANIVGAPDSSSYDGATCSGSGSTAVCAAAGTSNSTGSVAVTRNGGATWGIANIISIPFDSLLTRVSCTGNGSEARCVAVGIKTDTSEPLLVASTDGGVTWAPKIITGMPTNGLFTGVSCTGSGSTAVCTAVGLNSDNSSPLVVVSTNGGVSWTVKPFPSINGFLDGAGCTGEGSTAICLGVGDDVDGGLILASTDGGNTWSQQVVSGTTTNGRFESASCTGSGSSAVCIAAGTISAGPPLLAITTNGSATWAVQSVTGTPSDGCYCGSGAGLKKSIVKI